MGGGIQGSPPGNGFCPWGGGTPMLAIPWNRKRTSQRSVGRPSSCGFALGCCHALNLMAFPAFSAALSSLSLSGDRLAEYHSDGHSVVRNKKKPVHSKPAPENFLSAERKFDVPALCFTSTKRWLPICVIELAYLHAEYATHIRPDPFVNGIIGEIL